MKIHFTKMQGTGNDFIVINTITQPAVLEAIASGSLSAADWRRLADRRFGIGADQILLVQSAEQKSEADFVYRIFNADGQEVEQCGNGARCFARFVRDAGLSAARMIRVSTKAGIITPTIHDDGLVTVDMGPPRFSVSDSGFDSVTLPHQREGSADLWQLTAPGGAAFWVTVVSMGNPHAVQWVADVDQYPVAEVGAWCESHPRFAQRVNAGFAQWQSDCGIRLRVYERGSGETLACGTGACAAVAAGIRQGRLAAGRPIEVQTRGGTLSIQWSGELSDSVMMTGSAEPVYEGVIVL